jgi:hypothetical protein
MALDKDKSEVADFSAARAFGATGVWIGELEPSGVVVERGYVASTSGRDGQGDRKRTEGVEEHRPPGVAVWGGIIRVRRTV